MQRNSDISTLTGTILDSKLINLHNTQMPIFDSHKSTFKLPTLEGLKLINLIKCQFKILRHQIDSILLLKSSCNHPNSKC